MPRKATVKTEETPKTEQSVDMQALMQQMQEMQKQIEALKKEKEEAENKNSDSENIIEALKKSLAQKGDSDYEKEIPVVSECNGVLVLSTDGYGQGTKYKFDKIGEMQNIPFGDLKEICKNMKSFAQKGAFYILDSDAVKKLRLEGAYQKMLSNEDMENVLQKPANQIIELFHLATDKQKDTILSLIENAKMDGKDVDYNVLAVVGKEMNKNLIQMFDSQD